MLRGSKHRHLALPQTPALDLLNADRKSGGRFAQLHTQKDFSKCWLSSWIKGEMVYSDPSGEEGRTRLPLT